jgi:TQXA domain-containing protein
MKKINLLFLFLFISITFSNLTFSISKGNELQGSSIVKIYGTDKVVAAYFINPYTFDTLGVWAGTSYGDKDGSNAKFYCIDLVHVLYYWPEDPTTYTDDGNTTYKITYILNNYYPYKPFPYAGSLSAEEREAASVQMAIWYFSDGVDVTTLRDNPDIIARAQQIIADANLNAGNLVTDASLVINPTGTPGEFYVTALDQNNNPLAGVTVNLTSPTGTLSSYSEITDAYGNTPVITVTLLPDYTATINATANVTVHQGTIYERSIDPESYQKLVLATPNIILKEVSYTFDGLLPVELSSFTSNTNGRNIQLNWDTKSEKNSNKFVIEKKTFGTNWTSIGSVKAAVLSNSPKQYSFLDKNLQTGKYQYRLKMIDNDGSFEYSKIVETEVAVPKDFVVSQNYPNPFNPSTKIDYQVPVDAKVIMEVYNIAGQKVSELVNQEQSAGYYTVDFGASKLSSGVYIYRIVANDKVTGNNFSSIKKMMLLK